MSPSFEVSKAIISWFAARIQQVIKIIKSKICIKLKIVITTTIIIVSFTQSPAFAKDFTSLILDVEKEHNIPSGLLRAIAEVESGLNAYSVNIAGKPYIAKSNAEASKIVRKALKKGYTNIDIGLTQINWHWHGSRFNNIEEMLAPRSNVKYAAKLLTDLYKRHSDWQKVVRLYHSAKPHHHRKYSRKVLLSWLK